MHGFIEHKACGLRDIVPKTHISKNGLHLEILRNTEFQNSEKPLHVGWHP